MRDILDRLGDPHVIAAEARIGAPPPPPPPGPAVPPAHARRSVPWLIAAAAAVVAAVLLVCCLGLAVFNVRTPDRGPAVPADPSQPRPSLTVPGR